MTEREELGPFLAFGQWLREKRIEAKFVSQPLAEIRARKRRLTLINQGKLSHIERGMNSNPDPAFLKQLADLYELRYEEIITRWIAAKYDVVTDVSSARPITVRGDKGLPTAERGESDDPASDHTRRLEDRIQELEHRIAAYKTIHRQLRKRIFEAVALIGDSDEGTKPARKGSGRRGRD